MQVINTHILLVLTVMKYELSCQRKSLSFSHFSFITDHLFCDGIDQSLKDLHVQVDHIR